MARRIRLLMGLSEWMGREIALLGKLSDMEVSRRLARSVAVVQRARVALGIPALQARPQYREWCPNELALLGTLPDAALAKELDRTVMSIAVARGKRRIPVFDPQRRNWTPAEDALVGTNTDRAIAELLGRSVQVVFGRRRLLRREVIPAVKASSWRPHEMTFLGQRRRRR